MKKEKGITLIALIITIIIMLILVAVSISILINSGIIGKAQKAKQDTTAAYEKESKLGDNIIINGVEYESLEDYLGQLNNVQGAQSGDVKDIKEIYNKRVMLLRTNGELYDVILPSGEYNSIKYEDEYGTLIANNVKEIFRDLGNYYLTTTNDLYSYNWHDEEIIHIASNVKEYCGNDYYLTTTNDLCVYDWENSSAITIASNVNKAYYLYEDNSAQLYYITSTNELCRLDLENSSTIASNVKEYCGDGYYLTTTNDLCNYYETITIASNVKEYCGNDFYLTTTNDLYVYDWENSSAITIASNVKKAYIDQNFNYYYITNTNDLYYIDVANDELIQIANNVKDFLGCPITLVGCYYLTTNNNLCSYYKDDRTYTVESVINAFSKGDMILGYETTDGEVYLFNTTIK